MTLVVTSLCYIKSQLHNKHFVVYILGSDEEIEIKSPEWINADNSNLKVTFTPRALEDLQMFSKTNLDAKYKLDHLKDDLELKSAIASILRADPRSVYRKTKCDDKLYFFNVDQTHVTVWFDNNIAEVLRVKPNL